MPASYVLQLELIRAGKPRYRGGFADVNDGEYLERAVAIKQLRTNEGDLDKAFKVSLIDLVYCHRSLQSPSTSSDRASIPGAAPHPGQRVLDHIRWNTHDAIRRKGGETATWDDRILSDRSGPGLLEDDDSSSFKFQPAGPPRMLGNRNHSWIPTSLKPLHPSSFKI